MMFLLYTYTGLQLRGGKEYFNIDFFRNSELKIKLKGENTLCSVRFHCWYLIYMVKSLYPPQTLFVVGYTVFTLSVRASVRPSVTFCFFNNLKSHCWIFIKPCKHVHICKTNTLEKKVRARGQFY